MNKEQIIKRMNPVQLAKLNGPKTEVADNINQYPLTPDEMEKTTPSLYKAIVEDIPYEEVDIPRIDGPLTNVVGKHTGPNEYTYEGPIEELVELKTRMHEETAHLKLGPGLREQLKDEAFATQYNSPLDISKLNITPEPKSKKKRRRR